MVHSVTKQLERSSKMSLMKLYSLKNRGLFLSSSFLYPWAGLFRISLASLKSGLGRRWSVSGWNPPPKYMLNRVKN